MNDNAGETDAIETLTCCCWQSISVHFGGNSQAFGPFVHSNMRVWALPLRQSSHSSGREEGGKEGGGGGCSRVSWQETKYPSRIKPKSVSNSSSSSSVVTEVPVAAPGRGLTKKVVLQRERERESRWRGGRVSKFLTPTRYSWCCCAERSDWWSLTEPRIGLYHYKEGVPH